MDTIVSESVGFNPAPPSVLHVDLNSCFASIEQQANPFLRGKPIAVAAYTTPGGCVLTASREAKLFKVETGMRVGEAKSLCPALIVLPPDPWKYRFVNRKLLAVLRAYTSEVEVKSIDEMVLNFYNAPVLHGQEDIVAQMVRTGGEIKRRIKEEIGEWLTVSIGVAPNRYLAKIGAGLHKPDGLDVIHQGNIEDILTAIPLEGLTGIKSGYGGRLRFHGIGSAIDFYRASIKTLRGAFHSIIGYHWWLRLHGWEADDREFDRKSFGQSYALYKPYTPTDDHLSQILCQLVEKMSRRMRLHGYTASGIHTSCLFADSSFWHKGKKLPQALYAGRDLYEEARGVLHTAPDKPVKILAVSCHYLSPEEYEQIALFVDNTKKRSLVAALDKIADRYGDFVVHPARMMNMEHKVLDRIAFGGIKGLEEMMFRDSIERENV
jgi:DNA polymerase-4